MNKNAHMVAIGEHIMALPDDAKIPTAISPFYS